MTECFYCDTQLTQKAGKSKICVQLEANVVVVENEGTFFCPGCNEYYLTSEQLISSFLQIKKGIEKGETPIDSGIYN